MSPLESVTDLDAAAQQFVETVLADAFRDMVDLIERHEGAYRAFEQSVRMELSVLSCDLDHLENVFRAAIPVEHRQRLNAPLNRLVDAYIDELTTKQQTAYLIGVAVGRSLRKTAAAKAVCI